MTEQEWLVSENPLAMLEFARNPAHVGIAGQPYVHGCHVIDLLLGKS